MIIAFLLFCRGIIPGVIYIIWDSSRKQCPNCGLAIKLPTRIGTLYSTLLNISTARVPIATIR